MVEQCATKRVRVEPVNNAASENRKLRNRLSQKAFRARQSLYIKDLEKKLEWASKPESDQNAKLEETNKTLRGQLLDCHKKLESFQVTLKALADSVAYALGIDQKSAPDLEPISHNDSDDAESEAPPVQSDGQSEWVSENEPSLNSAFYDFSNMPFTTGSLQPQTLILSPKQRSSQPILHEKSQVENGTIVTSSLPRLSSNGMPHFTTRENFDPINLSVSTSFEHLMGPTQYNSYLGNNSIMPHEQNLQVNHTNSPFSDHITVFQTLLRQKLSKSSSLNRSNESLLNSAYFMLSTFIYHRISCQSNCCHIICDIGSSYVVEADVSKLVMGVGSAKGYIGVWDLVQSISPELFRASFELNKQMRERRILRGINLESHLAKLPAPNVAALFSSSQLALSAFVALGMDQGVVQYKLDPVFFERHPELYDSNSGMVASGAHLRPPERCPMIPPRPLDEGVLNSYKSLAAWADLINHVIKSLTVSGDEYTVSAWHVIRHFN
ncbi:hypothetical protein EYC80_000735 [Monilinia laxa]|uniref:BZIP domain-containing protein n=1 Tax=Monilinia laxa TaxID=61186 RepID=A0A5N6K758_MONLA|nr:hypothetical protein EYC80_000735 [Monilinia laxa]